MAASLEGSDQNQGARVMARPGGTRSPRRPTINVPFSSIRTVTVGFGIAPNLLTPPIDDRRALAG